MMCSVAQSVAQLGERRFGDRRWFESRRNEEYSSICYILVVVPRPLRPNVDLFYVFLQLQSHTALIRIGPKGTRFYKEWFFDIFVFLIGVINKNP